jgi:hypothetical protein
MVDSPDHTYLAAGFVPTHNTFLLQFLCYQFALLNIPVWFINPKGEDSLSDYAHFCGGELVAISNLQTEIGAFDPFRFAKGRDIVQIATDHITTSLNNNGDTLDMDDVIAISQALQEGVDHGAGSVGKSLWYHLPPNRHHVAERVINWARANANFALGIGWEPKEELGGGRRFTVVEFDQGAALPERTDPNTLTMGENSAIAGQRLLWRAGIEIMKTAGGGVVAGDEAWTFLSSPNAAEIINGLNRKGRSLGIFLALMTQRIADIDTADLEAYLSRVAVMHLEDLAEIEAALKLCRMESTPELVNLIRGAKPERPIAADPERRIPARPAKPAQMIFRDINGRHGVATVEPVVERYRLAFSTNRKDKVTRQQDREEASRGEGVHATNGNLR